MYYLDTCICIEFLRGCLQLGYQVMRNAMPNDFQLPSIVVAELFYGAAHSANPKKNRKTIEAFISAFTVAPFDTACASQYGDIRQALSEQGNLIGDRDIMIAATALANNATLVTNNVNEFKRVPGLRIESWAETTG